MSNPIMVIRKKHPNFSILGAITVQELVRHKQFKPLKKLFSQGIDRIEQEILDNDDLKITVYTKNSKAGIYIERKYSNE